MCVCRARMELLCPYHAAKRHLARIQLLVEARGPCEFLFPTDDLEPMLKVTVIQVLERVWSAGSLKQMHGFLWRKLPLLSRWPPCSKLWRQWFIRMTAPASLPSPGGRLAQQGQGGYTLRYHCAKTLPAQALKLCLREAICIMKVNAEASWQQVGPAELRRQFPADLRKATAAIGMPAWAF